MSHKAGSEFFRSKREWSRRKDQILKDYLDRYLPTLVLAAINKNYQAKDIVIVDGFAGPGRFDDGELGSPRIICEAVRNAKDPVPQHVKVLCVEPDPELHRRLKTNVGEFRFADTRPSRFLDVIPEIESLARHNNVLLYLDPFTVDGLEWEALDRVFRWLEARVSIEVLLNFNVDIFFRCACLALKQSIPTPDEGDEEPGEPIEIAGVLADRLDAIVGGNWWRAIVESPELDYTKRVRGLTEGFCDRLRRRFDEVCHHSVYAKASHRKPKYVLVFGSRSPTALEYMNDAMVRARDTLAEASLSAAPALFEMRPESLVPDEQKTPELLLTLLSREMTRKELVRAYVRTNFCRTDAREVRRMIDELAKVGRIRPKSNVKRIGDEDVIERA